MTFEISFGKVTYAPGAPKNAPRWVWACVCASCQANGTDLHGPFKTLRQAERDAEQVTALIAAEEGTHH